MFLGEFTLVVCFIAGAFTPSDPNRVTAWLNLWSLYAYCFHVMWYRLFGSPYGAIITFAGIPMFYFMTAASKPKESQEPKEPKDSKPPEHPQNHNFKPLPPKPWKSTWSMHGPLRTLPAFWGLEHWSCSLLTLSFFFPMVSFFVKFTFLMVIESVAKRMGSGGALSTDVGEEWEMTCVEVRSSDYCKGEWQLVDGKCCTYKWAKCTKGNFSPLQEALDLPWRWWPMLPDFR